MTGKRIVLVLLFVMALVGFSFVSSPRSFADDIPFGYSQVDEKPEEGEIQRIKTLNTKQELVARKIRKTDGTSELHSFKKGTLTHKVVYNKDGSRKAEYDYYPDGKLKRELRNGVLRFERRQLADWTFEAIRYKADGKRPQMRRRVGPGNTFELTHYRTGSSDKVWFTATTKGTSGSFEWQYFAEDGSHLRRVVGEKDMIVTVYDNSGNFKLEQVWTAKDDGTYAIESAAVGYLSGYRRYVADDTGKVVKVEDFDSDRTVTATWMPDQVPAHDAAILKEQFEDDDPTIPGQDD